MNEIKVYFVGRSVALGDFVEDVGDGSGNDTSVVISFCSSSDGVGLTRACLTISKYSSIITVKARLYHLAFKV